MIKFLELILGSTIVVLFFWALFWFLCFASDYCWNNNIWATMIEIAHMLFVYTPIELRVIILAGLIGVIYLHFKEKKHDNR